MSEIGNPSKTDSLIKPGGAFIMRKKISRIEKIRKNAALEKDFDRLMELNSLKVYDMINRF